MHGAAQWNQGARLGRQLRKGGKSILPWKGQAYGRCWVWRFLSSVEGSISDPRPNSAAMLVLKPKVSAKPGDLGDNGFSREKNKQKKAGGATVRRRYTFRENAYIIGELRALGAKEEEVYAASGLSPQQFLQAETSINTANICKWAADEDNIVKCATEEVTVTFFAKQQPKKWFPTAETELYKILMARRRRKLKVYLRCGFR